MTSTDHVREFVDPTGEQDEYGDGELPVAAEPLQDEGRIGPTLLIAFIGGLALVLAIATPVAGVKFASLLVVGAVAVIGLWALRPGGESE